MNKERILKLADIIEVQDDASIHDYDGFSMSGYFHSCGTPACIAGFAMAMEFDDYSEGLKAKAKESAIGDEVFGSFQDFVPARYLGLDDDLRSSLFAPERPLHNITPSMAAHTLRNLVETGEVVWVENK